MWFLMKAFFLVCRLPPPWCNPHMAESDHVFLCLFFKFFMFWLYRTACGISVSYLRLNLDPAVKALNPNHEATRELPVSLSCKGINSIYEGYTFMT